MRPETYRFDRANISTHVLMDPPHVCLWASDDVPLARVRGQSQPRKLRDATYGPIPADIVYVQPLWFTIDTALLEFGLRSFSFQELIDWSPRRSGFSLREKTAQPGGDYPPANKF